MAEYKGLSVVMKIAECKEKDSYLKKELEYHLMVQKKCEASFGRTSRIA